MANGGGRFAQRGIFEENVRVGLLETDLDAMERKYDQRFKDLEDSTKDALNALQSEIKSMRTILVGLLVSVSTGAVMVAINIAISSGG